MKRILKTNLMLAMLLGLLVQVSACTQLKEIPLFNPDARLANRIASAREFRTEVAKQVTAARTNGWLTQEQIDKSIVPSMDTAGVLIDEAEALKAAGDANGGINKLTAAKSLLQALKNQLTQLEKDKR